MKRFIFIQTAIALLFSLVSYGFATDINDGNNNSAYNQESSLLSQSLTHKLSPLSAKFLVNLRRQHDLKKDAILSNTNFN